MRKTVSRMAQPCRIEPPEPIFVFEPASSASEESEVYQSRFYDGTCKQDWIGGVLPGKFFRLWFWLWF